MEYRRHKYFVQQAFLDKLEPAIIEKAIENNLGKLNKEPPGEMFVTSKSSPLEVLVSAMGNRIGSDVPYGHRGLPALRKRMSHSNDSIAWTALKQLSLYLRNPEVSVKAVELHFIPRFVKCLKSKNEMIVCLALVCLRTMTSHPKALFAIMNNKYIVEQVKGAINHRESFHVRCEAASTVNSFAQMYWAVNVLVEAGYVKELMICSLNIQASSKEGCTTEPNTDKKDVLILHLDTLDKLLQESDKPKIEAMAQDCNLLFPLVNSKCEFMRRAATSFFCQIAKHPIGKEWFYRHEFYKPLYEILEKEEDIEIKTNIMKTFQFVTIHKEIRKETFKMGLIGYMLELLILNNVPSSCRTSALLILTNFAELPEGRIELRNYLSTSKFSLIVKLDGSQEMNNIIYVLLKLILT